MRAQSETRQWVFHGLYWLALYGVLWALLAAASGWGFGALCILAATLLSLWLGVQPVHIRLTALPQFLVFFLRKLFVGGWDVARRALHPSLPLNPAWVNYSLTCPNPRVRLVLSALVGLLPGTLSSRIEGDQLAIHTLDDRQPWITTVTRLEQHLSSLLGAES